MRILKMKTNEEKAVFRDATKDLTPAVIP